MDLCADGVCFLSSPGDYLEAGVQIWLRGDYPLPENELFQIGSFATVGQVLRTEPAGRALRRIAVKFERSLEVDFQYGALWN